MKIALDYDKTYNADPVFWDLFIKNCQTFGYDVRIVTARSPTKDRLSLIQLSHNDIEVIYCDGVAKRFVCHHFHDWDPDIWIDDKPESVGKNSTATKEILEKWRASEEYNY